MDPVSFASAVTGLVVFTEAVSKSVFTYAKSVKTCQKEIRQLSSEIATLFGILRGAQLLLDEFGSTAITAKQVAECWQLLQSVEDRLNKSRSAPASNHRVKNIVKNLTWPFTLTDTKELLTKIERQKTAFNLAISSEGLSAVVRNQTDLLCEVRDLHHEIQQRQSIEARVELNNHREEILSFLTDFDPMGHFNSNRKLRHEGTGMWFINGEKFCKWATSRDSHLWLFGIPGAGKTVLSTAIIETILSSNQNNEAIAYFYCDYDSQQTQEPRTIFASLAKQLAIQSQEAFDLVEQCYNTFHQNRQISGKVDMDHLIDLISAMTGCFTSTSIVLDGLDECGDNVITVMNLWVGFLQSSAGVLRTIVLSRDEWIIRRGFLDQQYEMISIAAQSMDIKQYAMAEIERRCQRGDLDIDDPTFKLFILEKLVEKAEGMFRWVACQFDFLQNLTSEEAYREALDSLPPGLPATYERMLERILRLPGPTQRIVQRALKWILFSSPSLDMALICEAASIELESNKHKARGIVKPAAIARHCGSFVRKSVNGNFFESAHFSVKEFFQSLDHETSPRFAEFCMNEESVRVDQTNTCLTYLTYQDFRRPVPRDLKDINKYAFYDLAARKFPNYARGCWHHESTQRLGKKLFNPKRSSNLLLWCHYYIFSESKYHGSWESFFDDCNYLLSSDRNLALRWAAILGIPFLVEKIVSHANEIDYWSYFGTPLHAAVLGMNCIGMDCIAQEMPSVRCTHDVEVQENLELRMFEFISNNWDDNRKSCAEKLLSYGINSGTPFCGPAREWISLLELSLYTADIGLIRKIAKLNDPLDEAWLKRLRRMYNDPVFEANVSEHFFQHMIDVIDAANITMTCEQGYIQFVAQVRSSAKLKLHPKDNLYSALRNAAKQGSVNTLEGIIAVRGIDIDDIGKMGMTALHHAAKSGSTRCVDLLVKAGASLSQLDSRGYSALHHAAQSGSIESAIMLIDLQSDAEIRTRDEETLAHLAAKGDNEEFLMCLLERFGKASLHVYDRDTSGRTPLLTAIEWGSSNSLRFLIPFSDLNDTDLHDEPLLHFAAKSLRMEYLDILVRNGADQMTRCGDGSNVLHHLAVNPQTTGESLMALINAGVSIHGVDKRGDTPLHRFLSHDHVDISKEDYIELLLPLTSKESISNANTNGVTPLCLLLDATIDLDLKVHILTIFLDLGANVCLGTDTRGSFFQEAFRRLSSHLHAEEKAVLSADWTVFVQERMEPLAHYDHIKQLLIVALETITEPQHLEQLEDNRRPLNFCLSFDDEISLKLLSRGVDPLLRNTDQQGYSALEQICASKQEDFHDELIAKIFTSCKGRPSPHPNGKTLLHILCEGPSIDVGFLEKIYSLVPAVNTRDNRGNLCLISAIQTRKMAFTERLLLFGARWDMIGGQDQCRWYPVHWAGYYDSVKLLDLLSAQNVDWNQKAPHIAMQKLNLIGCNALHLAVIFNRILATAFLLERKLIDVNAEDGGGNAPILLAARFCNARMIMCLIDQGADILARDKNDNSALHLAVFNEYHNEEIIPILVARGAPNEPNRMGETPEVLAMAKGLGRVIDILSSSQVAKKAQPAIRMAGNTGNSVGVRRSRLHAMSSAVKRGDLNLVKAIIKTTDPCIDQMYDCGVCSLFIISVYHVQSAITRWLFESGCDPRGQMNCGPDQGYNVIHLAAKRVEQASDLLVLLLDNLAVEEWSTCGLSPLHVSVSSRNVEGTAVLLRFLAGADELVECHPASAHHGFSSLRLVEVNKRLRDSPSDVRPRLELASNKQGHGVTILGKDFSGTPLHLAAFLGETDHVRLLLGHGAEVDITDAFTFTPLHFAAMKGNCKTAKLLLEHGSNPNRKTKIGKSTLMLAASSGSVDTFQTLVAYGADIDAQDATGQTALSYCGSLKMISHATMIGCKPGQSCHSWSSFDRIFNKVDGTAAYTLNSRLRDNVEPILLLTWLAMPTASFTMLWSCSRANPCSRSEEEMAEQARQYLVRAALRDDIKLIRRVCSALPRLNVEPLRHALVEAASWGRLQSVKDLFRRLALYLDERTNAAILAFNAAKQFQDLQAWILVDHSMEQSAIGVGMHASINKPIKQWSGVRQLEIPLEFRYAQVRRSLFEWAVWLHAEDKGQMIAYSRRRSKLRL